MIGCVCEWGESQKPDTGALSLEGGKGRAEDKFKTLILPI